MRASGTRGRSGDCCVSNLSFHQFLFGLCGNACLIETIELLARKVHGIRFYANAFPQSLDRARRDHLDMIKALRSSRRGELIELTRRHLKPSPEAYIKAYERRFGIGRGAAGLILPIPRCSPA